MASCRLNVGCTGLGHYRVPAFGTSERARLAVLCAAAVIAVLTAPVHGQTGTNIVLDEVLASWQGDPDVQFVELRLLRDGEQPPPA